MFRYGEDLRQELAGLQDFVGDIAQHLLEAAVLFARPAPKRMSSKSSSSIIAGTIRSNSAPGRCTRTEESFPISELTRRVIGCPEGREILLL
jgi:hypothetical protein